MAKVIFRPRVKSAPSDVLLTTVVILPNGKAKAIRQKRVRKVFNDRPMGLGSVKVSGGYRQNAYAGQFTSVHHRWVGVDNFGSLPRQHITPPRPRQDQGKVYGTKSLGRAHCDWVREGDAPKGK